MILVIADDFSGAAELAGIGRAYGLRTRLTNALTTDDGFDLLVVDVGSRSLDEQAATEQLAGLCDKINAQFTPGFTLFKKVDSVLRGHVLAELSILKTCFGYEAIALLPANPSKGRLIQNGHYLINSEPLDQTSFASDPEYPRRSAHLGDLLGLRPHNGSHTHLTVKTDLTGKKGLFTADVTDRADLAYYARQQSSRLLLAGAADLFEQFLLARGLSRQYFPTPPVLTGPTLFIGGSVHGRPLATKQGMDRAASVLVLSDASLSATAPQTESNVKAEIIGNLREKNTASLTVKAPLNCPAPFILAELARFVGEVVHAFGSATLNLFISGGSTASFLFKTMQLTDFEIIGEMAEGVVMVCPIAHQHMTVTIKPGSYAWPDFIHQPVSAIQTV